MDLNLQGKTAVMTGSTGGIGFAIARRLSLEGADVVISARHGDRVETALDNIRAPGGTARGVIADAATAPGAELPIAKAGQVDILVNCLGIYANAAFGDITDEDWLRFFDANIMSGVRLTRLVFPGMMHRNDGRVIFISSEVALAIPSDMIHYAMTKAAQHIL
ncbi:MAG: SDR family oxidoreductase [Mesorhizobium sp.]|nr:MAG: SDR family oxidoreductase [Mesorhizobium sp.]